MDRLWNFSSIVRGRHLRIIFVGQLQLFQPWLGQAIIRLHRLLFHSWWFIDVTYIPETLFFPALCFRITTPLPILCHLQRRSICFCGKHLGAVATRRPLDSFPPPPLCSPPLRTRLPSDPCLSAADRVAIESR